MSCAERERKIGRSVVERRDAGLHAGRRGILIRGPPLGDQKQGAAVAESIEGAVEGRSVDERPENRVKACFPPALFTAVVIRHSMDSAVVSGLSSFLLYRSSSPARACGSARGSGLITETCAFCCELGAGVCP